MVKPTHPVELLAAGIATQEGWFDSDPGIHLRHNPGNLRYAGQPGTIEHPDEITQPPVPLATFVDDAHGVCALFRQIWIQVAVGQTVRQIISQWAPPTENNTSQYLQDILEWTGLPPDVPVLQLLPPLVQLNVHSNPVT